jgi:LacI family transcriptional regulator, galactose operon repressor
VAVTLSDIAKRAKVAAPTVSIVLNNKPKPIKVSEATRKRIFQVAKEMNYRPNLLARGLAKGKTQTIGFLTGSPTLEMVSAMTAKLDNFADDVEYGVYTVHTEGKLDLTVKRANDLIARGVDGLIIRGSFPQVSPDTLKVSLNFPVPTVIVSLDQSIPFACRQVREDGAVGVKQAVGHLYRLGHRQIYMLRSDWKGWEKDLRFAKFLEAVKSYGLSDPEKRIYKISESSHVNSEGYRVFDMDRIYLNMKEFLKSHPDCTAMLCSSDSLALLVFSTLTSLGIKVPEDVSIVGFDNLPATLYTRPSLSTIARPIEKIMRTAFDMLLDSIEKNNNEPKEIAVPTEFIPRQSIGPVREGK